LRTTNSVVKQFLYANFQTNSIVSPLNKELTQSNFEDPKYSDIAVYGYIGTAFDYRVRYSFAITPYKELIAWKGANIVACGFLDFELIQVFFEQLQTFLKGVNPVQNILSDSNERTLDRYCIILGLFEQVYRSSYSLGSPLAYETITSLEELLAIPDEAWITDMVQLIQLFSDHFPKQQSSTIILNPTFVGSRSVGGADADLIVNGCLIDIKCTIKQTIPSVWFRQLAGYLLLDWDDRYHLTSVGFYMARQGKLFTWSIDEFLSELTGYDFLSIAQLRKLQSLQREFRNVCSSRVHTH